MLGPWRKSPAPSTTGSGLVSQGSLGCHRLFLRKRRCLSPAIWAAVLGTPWWFWLQKQQVSVPFQSQDGVIQTQFLISSCINCHHLVSEPLACV